MIPLVSTESELKILRALVNKIAKEIEKENKNVNRMTRNNLIIKTNNYLLQK